MNKIIIAFALPFLPFTVFAQCKDSTRADPYYHCDLPYQPVCGCDNVTYRNTCAALNWGGIINGGLSLPWTDGICPNTNFDFDFVPNPVSAITQSLSDSPLHIFINETLLPTGYVIYIVDMFNKVVFQGDGLATTNVPAGSSDWGTPVTDLTTDFFSRMEKGVYILIIQVNGEQKTKKIVKVDT